MDNENKLWGNPCDYTDPDTRPKPSGADNMVPLQKRVALELVAQAKNTLKSALEYKNAIAKLHSYTEFNDLLKVTEGDEWLRKMPWHSDLVLPKEKKLFSSVPEDYVFGFMDKINGVVSSMSKSLKMVVAGLHAFSEDGLNDIMSDESLKLRINHTMHDVRAILCSLNEIVIARDQPIIPLRDAELPNFKSGDTLALGLLVYRDTLNYLEYLVQVFEAFATSPAV